jgi:D-alanyl-lipoteichoic acid acyltransferase DltB (MBOAT superfamily)
LASKLLQGEFFFFLGASLTILLLAPRYLVLAAYVIRRFALGHTLSAPDTSQYPYIPNLLSAFVVLFLATFFLSARARLTILLVASLPMAMVIDGRIDLPSLGFYAILLGAVYGLIKLPINRWLAASLVCVLSVAFAVACNTWSYAAGTRIAAVSLFQASFTPMLWYSVYQHVPPRQRLSPWRFLVYHYVRLFGSPVFNYGDLFSPSSMSLSRIRFDGFKALYVAIISATVAWAVTQLRAQVDASELGGISLLVYSYLVYLGGYCKTVVLFNACIGVLRLFGVPVRNNFNYWILARTPNEHWQRWNILLREWVITFVFFPIMRAKRWLFVAVMAALLTSGALHLIPQLIRDREDTFHIWSMVFYWILNGLTIYLVIKIPKLFPRVFEKLGMDRSPLWSFFGILFTSAFYAIMHYTCRRCDSWSEIMGFLSRLFLGT